MLRELERRSLATIEVDLAGAARSVVARLGVADRVVVSIPEGTFAADHDLVIKIMTDLLDHALENAPDGSTITICADSEKSGLRLWVSDHRVGVDPVERTALIERSQRGRPAARRSGPAAPQ
jgi:two-component system OmpR family sensor kinase